MKRTFLLALAAVAAFGQNFNTGKTLGNPQAPVRIELYSDYQCPSCKALHEQTVAPLIQGYVNTGKVYLVHREFPLPVHNHALEAARIACAAGQMGKYREVCDQLFRTQDAWSKSGDVAGSAAAVLSPAEAKRLRELAASAAVAQSVEADQRAGQAEKITGTPTMVIMKNIRRFPVNGAVSYPVLSRFIDSLL